MTIIRRGIRILQKDGVSEFLHKGGEYLIGAGKAVFSPANDPRNANWHRYISDLDGRVEHMAATPWKLEIASTTMCNLQCAMCGHVFQHGRAGRHLNPKMLSGLETFISGAGQFQLMGWGEPLISPAFWKIMDIISKNPSRKQAFIEISSNGAAMTPYIVEKILSSPLGRVSFSIDAATPETYRKIRGADFNQTLENIRHLIKRKNALGKKFPEIMCNMTLMRENIRELPDFVDIAHDLGADSLQFWPLHDYEDISPDSWNVERFGWHFNYRDQMLGRDSRDAAKANMLIDAACEKAAAYKLPIVWPMDSRVKIDAPACGPAAGAEEAVREIREMPLDCVAPWEWMLVDIDGDVRPCCYIQKPFGNLNLNSADEIWNGPDYREMRRCLASGKMPPQCAGAACKYVRGRRYYMPAGENHK